MPVTQLDQVSKYIGPKSDDKPLKLSKLGGKDWQKTRSRVKSAVKDMAKELIELYSKRIKIKGHSFSPDIDMQNDFERRFEFVETDDQLRCIHEIKKDMEKIIKTPCGEIQGTTCRLPGVTAFKGIRYATAGRWEYPVEVTKWDGVYDASEYGGAPVIGLNGLVIKSHGSSDAKEIKNSIFQCITFVEADIANKIREQITN